MASRGSSRTLRSSSRGSVMFDGSSAFKEGGELELLNLALMERNLNFRGSKVLNEFCSYRYVLKHDFLLLQYAPKKWIKAEKHGESARGENDAGITLSVVDELDAPEDLKAIDGSSIRFQTDNVLLGKGKDRWSLAKMFELLTNGAPDYGIMAANSGPDYDVLAANCWMFAFSSAKGVLNWCIENAEAEDVRKALNAKLVKLVKVERPEPRDWRTLLIPWTHSIRPFYVEMLLIGFGPAFSIFKNYVIVSRDLVEAADDRRQALMRLWKKKPAKLKKVEGLEPRDLRTLLTPWTHSSRPLDIRMTLKYVEFLEGVLNRCIENIKSEDLRKAVKEKLDEVKEKLDEVKKVKRPKPIERCADWIYYSITKRTCGKAPTPLQ